MSRKQATLRRFAAQLRNRISARTLSVAPLAVFVGLIVAVQPALAQDGGGGSLGDVIVWAIKEALRVLFSPIKGVIQQHADALVTTVVETPHPETVFSRPTNGSWPKIYDYYWNAIIPVSLFLYALALGLVIFLESTSYLFSNYHRTKLKKRAFSGLLGLLAWWWVDALARQLLSELTVFLVPDLSQVSLFQTLSFSSMGALGVVLTLSADFGLFVLLALIYFLRQVALYLFTLMMPLLIVFWIPGIGPFTMVSRLMKRLAGFYVPFLFMTLPVALLFRLGELLGSSFSLSMGGVGAWLTALVIPIVAVLSPFVLFWQAGAIFFMADRIGRHASARRTTGRMKTAREQSQTVAQGGRNFARGVRDDSPVRQDGQTMSGSGNSRAHAAGSRLNSAGTQLRDSLQTDSGESGSTSNAGGTQRSGSSSRDVTLENLRSDDRRSSSSQSQSDDRSENNSDSTTSSSNQ
ncbi:hypothetical protein M0R89_04000 [Halorussus limi]|uniref:Uncharacterized protein n=1 Tax=Halorussus limi TaxID=2938695 RepID=A0A8U0HWE5_9EURY|nr:hypothetical protein [Halorussus limi]UPV75238.1 hypothetical protein M0R89_04000 [Halorussus limi]